MFLFIFESIGTSELLLIGVIALIFLGPRKLPQMVRTIGKSMAEFRRATNEFKSTWEREVDLESFDRDETPQTIPRTIESNSIAPPEIMPVDAEKLKELRPQPEMPKTERPVIPATESDKSNWL